MEPCAASQSAAATNGRFLGGKTASLRTRNAERAVGVIKQTRVPESRSSSELAGARRSRSTTATCTEHHEGGSGRMHFSSVGLARGSFHQRVHASTYASRAAGRKPDHPEVNALSSALLRNRGPVQCWRAEARVDRGRPGPRLLVPLSAGAASARSPFATPSPPMGVRGRGP